MYSLCPFILPVPAGPGSRDEQERTRITKRRSLGRDGEALAACGEYHALNRLNEKDH